jgi:hypothetical protein
MSIWHSLPGLFIGAALLIFIFYLIIYGLFTASLLRFPFDYDQGEGFELVDTIMFSRGELPYQDIESYPFYSSNYPPVFHLAVVPLVWIFGPEYWTGRLVSFIGTLITAAAIGYAVQRASRRWWLSSLAGLAFLASNYVYHVGPLFRQHMFMVMFETLAIVTLVIVTEKEETEGKSWHKGLLVVMLFLFLAGYTKQLAYATVAAAFIFLFLRSPKRAVKWAVPFTLVVAVAFLLINLATDGHWLTNTITANVNPFIPGQAIGLFQQWFNLHTVLIFAASIFALYQLYFERLSAYTIWYVFAVINAATAGKWGAGESYFATAVAAACILTGIAFGRVLNWGERRGVVTGILTTLFVTLLFLVQADKVFHMPTDTPSLELIAQLLDKPTETSIAPQTSCSEPRPPEKIKYVDAAGVGLLGRRPDAGDIEAGNRLSNWVSKGNSPAFAEDAGFNLSADREVITNPTQLLNLYNNDEVDISQMLAMITERRFDTVIFRAQFYPPPILEAIGDNYDTVDLIEMNGFVYCVLVPRSSANG